MAERYSGYAERLYRQVWRHYMFMLQCIRPEDARAYEGDWTTYLQTLASGIPSDPRRTIAQIDNFLQQHALFRDEAFADAIDEVWDRVSRDPEAFKARSLEILRRTSGDPALRDAHPPLFQRTVGTWNVVLPTYGNPLLTVCYSLLFSAYAVASGQRVNDG